MTPCAAMADDGRVTIDIGEVSGPGDGWTYDTRAGDRGEVSVVTLTKDVAYRIRGQSEKKNVIEVAEGVSADILLSGVEILWNHYTIYDVSAFRLRPGARVTLRLEGDNIFSSFEGAGIRAPRGTELTITSAGGDGSESGTLTVSAYVGAGIGGIGGSDPDDASAGKITINGGTIETQGSPLGVGIGGNGSSGDGGEIVINGGSVRAIKSSYGGSAIGGGKGNGTKGAPGGSVIINGGTVVAEGSIGGGNEAHCGEIVINGGDVTASEGIGGSAPGGSIKITGGTVTTSGPPWPHTTPGIGEADSIEITGGVVYASGGALGGAGIGGGRDHAAGEIRIRSAGGSKLFLIRSNDASGAAEMVEIYRGKGALMVMAAAPYRTGTPPAQPIGHGSGYAGDADDVVIDAIVLDNVDDLPVLPEIGGVTAERSDATSATVTFTSNVGGSCYYSVMPTGGDAPIIDVSGEGAAVSNGTNGITVTGLSESASTVYIRIKGERDVLSDQAAAIIPAYSEWASLTADGVAGASDTKVLTMTFSSDPGPLTADSVTLAGAEKGELTGEGNVRKLAISGISVANGATVRVALNSPKGHFITPANRDVAVYRADADVTAPVLSGGSAARTAATAAVKFTSSEDGVYYYTLAEASAPVPDIPMLGDGREAKAGENTLTIYNLSASAKSVYIKMRDATGNVSQTLKVDIPAGESAGSGNSADGGETISGDKTTDETETPQAPPGDTETGAPEAGGPETSAGTPSVVIDTPITPSGEDVYEGLNTVTFEDTAALPEGIATAAKPENGLVFPRIRAVLAGLDADDTPAVDEEHAVPLPVFRTEVPDKGATGVVTLEMRLDALADRALDSVYALKLRRDGSTVILARANSLRDIGPSQFIVTDHKGSAFTPGETVKRNTDYCVSIAVRDNGPDDALLDDEGVIIDPAVLVSLGAGVEDDAPASGGSGGCDAGFARLAALAVAIGLALLYGSCKRGEAQ